MEQKTLPPEILIMVLNSLPATHESAADILNVGRACRAFQRAATSEPVWNHQLARWEFSEYSDYWLRRLNLDDSALEHYIVRTKADKEVTELVKKLGTMVDGHEPVMDKIVAYGDDVFDVLTGLSQLQTPELSIRYWSLEAIAMIKRQSSLRLWIDVRHSRFTTHKHLDAMVPFCTFIRGEAPYFDSVRLLSSLRHCQLTNENP